MKVEFIIESAVKQGFDEALVEEALIKADDTAIKTFIDELSQARLYKLNGAVIWHLLSVVQSTEGNPSLDILGSLLKLPHVALYDVIDELGQDGSTEALNLIRKALSSQVDFVRKWAAEKIIAVQHKGDVGFALEDEAELVRRIAVNELEKRDDIESLMTALENEDPYVKRTAVWYMGRNQVKDSVELLTELIQHNQDTETMRALIWSLGILRDPWALQYIEPLCQHTEHIIAETAQEAVEKLRRAV